MSACNEIWREGCCNGEKLSSEREYKETIPYCELPILTPEARYTYRTHCINITSFARMQFLKALVVISSIAHAMSTSPDSVERFNLIHQRNKVNSRVSTTAWSWDWSVMLAHSCSSSLLSWPFEQLPVHFDVDENGVGLVLLGPTSHTLQGLNRSEHVHCSGMYGKEESAIMCAIAAPLTTAIIHPSAELTALDCGSEDPLGLASLVRRLSIPHSTNRGQSISRENRKAMFAGSAQEATLSKQRRQGACGAWSKHTAKFEDGHPHQLPLHKQLSVSCRAIQPQLPQIN